jgi:hypothetical protein
LACAWLGALHSRRELAQTPSAADFAGPLAREIVRQDATSVYGHGGFNPIVDQRCRIIPQPEAVRRRFASHAVITRIRSYFRNLFVISSLSLSFPFTQKHLAPKIYRPSRGDSTFGSRNRGPNWLLSSHGARCLRAFPGAVPRLSSPNQSARALVSGPAALVPP